MKRYFFLLATISTVSAAPLLFFYADFKNIFYNSIFTMPESEMDGMSTVVNQQQSNSNNSTSNNVNTSAVTNLNVANQNISSLRQMIHDDKSSNLSDTEKDALMQSLINSYIMRGGNSAVVGTGVQTVATDNSGGSNSGDDDQVNDRCREKINDENLMVTISKMVVWYKRKWQAINAYSDRNSPVDSIDLDPEIEQAPKNFMNYFKELMAKAEGDQELRDCISSPDNILVNTGTPDFTPPAGVDIEALKQIFVGSGGGNSDDEAMVLNIGNSIGDVLKLIRENRDNLGNTNLHYFKSDEFRQTVNQLIKNRIIPFNTRSLEQNNTLANYIYLDPQKKYLDLSYGDNKKVKISSVKLSDGLALQYYSKNSSQTSPTKWSNGEVIGLNPDKGYYKILRYYGTKDKTILSETAKVSLKDGKELQVVDNVSSITSSDPFAVQDLKNPMIFVPKDPETITNDDLKEVADDFAAGKRWHSFRQISQSLRRDQQKKLLIMTLDSMRNEALKQRVNLTDKDTNELSIRRKALLFEALVMDKDIIPQQEKEVMREIGDLHYF